MNKGVFIVGTDTEVGKTVVTAGLLHVLLQEGIRACSFKAVQSGGTWDKGHLIDGDTTWIKKVCQIDEDYCLMNPYPLQPEVSPHLAARLEGKIIKRENILNAFAKLQQKYDYIVAEGAGGVIVPLINNEYYIYNLIKDLNLPVVIVTRAGLGAINHTILTLDYLQKLNIEVTGIIVNNFTGQIHEKDNIECIKNIGGKKILAVIDHLNKINDDPDYQDLKNEFSKKININDFIS